MRSIIFLEKTHHSVVVVFIEVLVSPLYAVGIIIPIGKKAAMIVWTGPEGMAFQAIAPLDRILANGEYEASVLAIAEM